MKDSLLHEQIRSEKGHSRTASQSGEPPFITALRSRVMPLVQRAISIPNPIARALKLAGVVLIFFLLLPRLHMPDTRPYTTDLVLKTTDLRNDAGRKLIPPGDGHGLQGNETAAGAEPSSNHAMDCSPDVRKLREIRDRYELDDKIEYLKRYVRFTRKPIERQSFTTLKQSFLPDRDVHDGFRTLHLSKSLRHEEKCRTPLEVPVPQSRFPADVDLSDFLFAISTTYDRLGHPSTIREWAHWLTDGSGRPNGGKLLVRLLDATDPQLMNITQQLADVGIDAEVSAWDSRLEKEMAVRYLNLVPMLYTHKASSTRKWLVLCDDDTFFTSMNRLITRFKQYDHTKPLYIGTLSEDIVAVSTHGSQAFGGGGVFLSRSMARAITTLHEECKTEEKIKESNSGWGPQGDILLRKCIYENTDVRLTYLHELWQLDLSGDATGFYESGLQPYSVHHFKGSDIWHTAYPLNTTKIAYTCGEDCPYQRFVTTDNFVISNGYSIAQYPDGIDFDLNQVERTFHALRDDHGWNFDYTFGPQRPSLHRTGKKIAWELRDSQHMDDGSVVQVYIRKKDDQRWTTEDEEPMRTLDGVIELVWIPA